MLSFKNNQNVAPLYDYYVETDLDSFDDQPVDYSKKYSDQDSYEECRRAKSSLKPNQLPSETPPTLKQTSNDELKIYCIEGTPLTNSYASSLSDLREVGTNCSVDKLEDKRSFSSVNDDGIPESFAIDNKKDMELLDSSNEEAPISKDKEDVKEGKSVSFRNSTDISKASSPLMFSRSSSIGSLTSFEQQSIVDDRSSVSVFSALTSGLISPSDLPDSPGELMSSNLTDKDDNNSKIDVTKVDSDNECENNNVEEKDEIHPKDILKIQLPEKNVHGKLDLNKNSEDDDEVVALQLETLNDSLDEVFENPDIENKVSFPLKNEEIAAKIADPLKSEEESDDDENQELQHCLEVSMPENSPIRTVCNPEVCAKPVFSSYSTNNKCEKIELKLLAPLKPDEVEDSDDDEELLQHCIEVGAPEETSNRNVCNSKVYSKPVYPSHSNSAEYQYGEIESKIIDPLKPDEVEDSDEDEELLQRCIEVGAPEDTPNRNVSNSEVFAKPIYPSHSNSTDYQYEKITSKVVDPLKSDEESDDELLQQCIEVGMPENSPIRTVCNSEVFAKPVYSSHSTNNKCEKIQSKAVPPLKPDEVEDSDDDEELLQRCIEAGMPINTPNRNLSNSKVFSKPVYLSHSSSAEYQYEEYPFKDRSKSYQPPHPNIINVIPSSCQQCSVPSKVEYSAGVNKKPENIQQHFPAKKMSNNVYRKPYAAKSDADCYCGDNDELLQRSTEMRMPEDFSEKKNVPFRVLVKPEFGASQYHFCSHPFKDRSKSFHPHHPNTINVIPSSYQQYRVPSKVEYNDGVNKKLENIQQHSPAKKMAKNVYRKLCAAKSDADCYCDENDELLQHGTEMRMPENFSEKRNLLFRAPVKPEFGASQFLFCYDVRDNCPDGISDGDENDAVLQNCINAGPKLTCSMPRRLPVLHMKQVLQKQHIPSRPLMSGNSEPNKKCNYIRLPFNQPYAPVHSNGIWISNTSFIEVDSMRVYRTEDTPVLSPTASVSDLSSLSINESFLNNSRNSDCSESDDDDELLQQCIRSGMPEAKRAVA